VRYQRDCCTDGGGPDITYTDTFWRSFVRIALFDEFVAPPTGLRAQRQRFHAVAL
jgi:hypothetical protein